MFQAYLRNFFRHQYQASYVNKQSRAKPFEGVNRDVEGVRPLSLDFISHGLGEGFGVF